MAQILWVDDEIDLLKPYILFLETKGYEVLSAIDGNEALDILAEGILPGKVLRMVKDDLSATEECLYDFFAEAAGIWCILPPIFFKGVHGFSPFMILTRLSMTSSSSPII